jgi:hypothetical protein
MSINLAEPSMRMINQWHWVLSVGVVLMIAITLMTATNAPTTAVAMQAGTPVAISVPATVAASAVVTATGTLSGTLPTIPAPVVLQVDPKTTAYLVLDLTS